MSFMDKVYGKLGLGDAEETEALLEEEKPKAEKKTEPVREAPKAAVHAPLPPNVVDIHAAANGALRPGHAGMKVVVIEPKSFDDVQQVANCLKDKKPVVINFEHTGAEDAHRIIDFISGTTYALAGDIKKLGHNVFLCAPSNVSVSYTQERGSIPTDISWLKK